MSTERQTFVEIDLPVCGLIYGQSPCTAAIGSTAGSFGVNANADRKCYNTRATCQDLDNYDEEDRILRLAEATLNLDPNFPAIPSIVGIDYTPPRINLAEGLGERSVLRITIQDHPFPDTGPAGDKYLDDRDFDPFMQGTFWGKFRSRYPFMRQRRLRWITGPVGDSLESMERREFVIDRIDGPDISGRVVITAKDPVSFLDDQRALTPKLSRGQLIASLAASGSVSATVTPIESFNDYPASGFISVGGTEIMGYTSKTAPNTLNVTARGQFGTPSVAHEAEERVQFCRVIDDGSGGAIRADEFLIKLLTEDEFGNADSGPIPASFIRSANWKEEAETFLAPSASGELFSGIITEPEPIADIVNEFCQSIAGSIWWNDLEQLLKFETLKVQGFDGNRLYDDNIILADTFSQRTMERDRISRVFIFYAPLNALEQTEDKNNYLQAFLNFSARSEAEYGTPSIKEIFSRFIRGGSRPAAERTAEFLLSRYALPPRRFSFTVPRDDDNFIPQPVLGEHIGVENLFIQDDTGLPEIRECQIIGVTPSSTSWQIEAEEVSRSDVQPPGRIGDIVPILITSNVNTGLNLSEVIRTASQTQDIQSGDIVRIVIGEGVVVTNVVTRTVSAFLGLVQSTVITGAAGPALITGDDLPDGVTVQLVLQPDSIVAGAGGRGGFATMDEDTATSGQGEAGETGIVATQPLQLFFEAGATIAGGGGGGAGAAARGKAESVLRKRHANVAAAGGGGRSFGLGGTAIARILGQTAEERPDRARETNGSRASFDNAGSGGNAKRTVTIKFLFITLSTRTVTATGGNGGNFGQPGSGSTVSGANVTSSTHATGGAAGFAIRGESNITKVTDNGTILGPTQANP